MTIELENIYSDKITIPDLGLELQTGSIVNMLSNYTRDEILESQDLETIYNEGKIQFTIDSASSSLTQVIKALTGMTEHEHENAKTLKHWLSEPAYFQVERDEEDNVIRIVYYTNNSLSTKIRQEEIVRDIEGNVVEIIKKQFDSNGLESQTEKQILNRNTDGSVVSIETIVF